jgi:hypothetical protein
MDHVTTLDPDTIEDLEEDLLARAFLFDPPQTYRDAVEEVFEALRAAIARKTTAA